MHSARWLALSLLLICAPPAVALDGVIEINQTIVQEAGGFPFVIATPGSYALTSDLAVPADTQAILIRASGVHLDLRGFRIEGPYRCGLSSCAPGTIAGIGIQPEFASQRITVRGGEVRGFPGTCIFLASNAYVAEMLVSDCGSNGIQATAGSLLRANRVVSTAREGIVLNGDNAAFADNVVTLSGRAFPNQASVRGGTAIGGNLCTDGGCSARGRRYYLSQIERNGQGAPNACSAGFHMASLFELLGGGLVYDTVRGETTGDSGGGPPVGLPNLGWVRTGALAFSANCQGYTTTSGNGISAFIIIDEDEEIFLQPRRSIEWRTLTGGCSATEKVWCVED